MRVYLKKEMREQVQGVGLMNSSWQIHLSGLCLHGTLGAGLYNGMAGQIT
jgi:hypothetical protein